MTEQSSNDIIPLKEEETKETKYDKEEETRIYWVASSASLIFETPFGNVEMKNLVKNYKVWGQLVLIFGGLINFIETSLVNDCDQCNEHNDSILGKDGQLLSTKYFVDSGILIISTTSLGIELFICIDLSYEQVWNQFKKSVDEMTRGYYNRRHEENTTFF
jgi:hypothetical protein